MDLLSRYRNITVLLLVIFAQLILLGYQVKSNQDVRLIRVWAVTAVTPMARVIEGVRSSTTKSLGDYVNLHDLAAENKDLKVQVGKLKLENQYLKSELQSADRAVALSAYQSRTPSKTLPARVIGTGTGANSKVVFIDRGSGSNVMRGMAVITPDGIVGKVLAAYPTASQVLLITDPTFAAGVISQKHRVHGTVRGQGHSTCMVDYIQNEEQVDANEWFYTSGDDGVFPKGLPVGSVTVARPGNPNKQVFLVPSGLSGGLEEVLIVMEGVHQPIPEPQGASADVHLQQPPPAAESAPAGAAQTASGEPILNTEADRLREKYKKVGEAQAHKFGEGALGSRPPDFNLDPDRMPPRAPQAVSPAQQPKPASGTGRAAGAPSEPANQAGARPPEPGVVTLSAPEAGRPGVAVPAVSRSPRPASQRQGGAPDSVKPRTAKQPDSQTGPANP